ncbi:hypothetical protein RHGRI_013083 [Rhododendron griersonianum]|uniref:Uncharacterized protein n=1 Tax=Rhododendron griersonianum TaxID=479676 RepID=A0AAV6K4N8_9ERIC|nr:hypothetical protein RHGRI_013083 [Rhododendron griersonianum]
MDILPQVNANDVAHDLPDVNATDVAYDAGMKNLENMQLVLFKDNSKDMAAKRSSRPLEQSCIPQGRGTVSSAVEVNLTLTSFLNMGVGQVGHQFSFELPLVHSPAPTLIQSQVLSSLGLAPFNKNLHHQNNVEKALSSNKISVTIDSSKEAKKPKRKVKSVEEILGIPQARNRKGGRRRKQKCVVFRSALAAAALSVSTEGINNRNRILLNESHACHMDGYKYLGNGLFGQ